MTFTKKILAATLLTAGGFAAISSANAADSDTFTVTTEITAVCDVNADAANVSFTGIAAGTTGETIGNQKAAGDISVMCSNGAPYVVNLSTLGNSTSTIGEGKMVGGTGNSDVITYQLSSTAEGKAWGNTGALGVDAAGNGVAGTGIGVSTPILHPVYAKITSTTDVKEGTYSDTITASIIY